MFKVGDKVKCIDDTGHIENGKIYTIKEIAPHIGYATVCEMIYLEEVEGGFWNCRFKNVNRELKLKKILYV